MTINYFFILKIVFELLSDNSDYLYIIYSATHNIFYIGYSNNPKLRLIRHNSSPFKSFTSKYRPWELKCIIPISVNLKEAIKFEKYLKQQKSSQLLKWLIEERLKEIREVQINF